MGCIKGENRRQLKKWGVQKRTLPEWLMYLTEEVGELNESSAEFIYRMGSKNEIFDEAIQVATLALKIAEFILYEARET
jgi:hypothetical protein